MAVRTGRKHRYDSDGDPHKRLWAAVVMQAIDDARAKGGRSISGAPMRPVKAKIQNALTAMEWLFTFDCKMACDLAGIEPDMVMRGIGNALLPAATSVATSISRGSNALGRSEGPSTRAA